MAKKKAQAVSVGDVSIDAQKKIVLDQMLRGILLLTSEGKELLWGEKGEPIPLENGGMRIMFGANKREIG